MIKKFLIALAILTLTACGDENGDSNDYEYGVLKSEPPMPPLTYTWSHPDCPFTANFPGEPEVEVIEGEDQSKEIIAHFSGNYYGLWVYCDVDRLPTAASISSETELFYINLITEDPKRKNTQINNLKESIFAQLPNVKIHFGSNFNQNETLHNNSLVFQDGTNLFTTRVIYPNIQKDLTNGVEFFETIKIK